MYFPALHLHYPFGYFTVLYSFLIQMLRKKNKTTTQKRVKLDSSLRRQTECTRHPAAPTAADKRMLWKWIWHELIWLDKWRLINLEQTVLRTPNAGTTGGPKVHLIVLRRDANRLSQISGGFVNIIYLRGICLVEASCCLIAISHSVNSAHHSHSIDFVLFFFLPLLRETVINCWASILLKRTVRILRVRRRSLLSTRSPK